MLEFFEVKKNDDVFDCSIGQNTSELPDFPIVINGDNSSLIVEGFNPQIYDELKSAFDQIFINHRITKSLDITLCEDSDEYLEFYFTNLNHTEKMVDISVKYMSEGIYTGYAEIFQFYYGGNFAIKNRYKNRDNLFYKLSDLRMFEIRFSFESKKREIPFSDFRNKARQYIGNKGIGFILDKLTTIRNNEVVFRIAVDYENSQSIGDITYESFQSKRKPITAIYQMPDYFIERL